MSDSAIAARLIDALNAAADEAVGATTSLVSIEITMLQHTHGGSVQTQLARKTRTLVFMSADVVAESGARIASATSVHKVQA